MLILTQMQGMQVTGVEAPPWPSLGTECRVIAPSFWVFSAIARVFVDDNCNSLLKSSSAISQEGKHETQPGDAAVTLPGSVRRSEG